MSESTAPRSGPSPVKLWAGFLLLLAAALALAWFGAGGMRPQGLGEGIEFRAVSEGSGDPIGAGDAALLDYVGTFDDGTVFDSSEAHGGPQPFAQEMVFPGFAEAMSRMREGGQYRFSFPQKLAFGDGPRPEGFPADSDLNFEVRVRQIVRGGAAMMQRAPQPGQ